MLVFVMRESLATEFIISPSNSVQLSQVDTSKKILKKFSQFNSELQNPNKLEVQLSEHSHEIFYEPTLYLNLSLKMGNYDSYNEYQTHSKTQIVWAHEFAHSVFSLNLAKSSDKFAQIYDAYARRAQLITRSESCQNSECHDQVNTQLSSVLRSIANNNELFNSIASYDELFADIYAVLYYNDPKIMSKALTFQTMSLESKHFAQERDFTHYKNPHTHAPSASSGHDYLQPARFEFWKIASRCKNISGSLKLKLAYKAIESEAISTFKNGLKSPKEANIDMITKFNHLFKCHEL